MLHCRIDRLATTAPLSGGVVAAWDYPHHGRFHDGSGPTWVNRPSRLPGPRRSRVLALDCRLTLARVAVGTSRIGLMVAAITASLAIALLSDRASANEAGFPQAAFDERATGGPVLSIRYTRGLIDYQITGIPLNRALDELAVKTGMLAVVNDPAIAARPVSASAQAVPLEHGIKHLLEGFSFALYPVAGSHAVVVLSTPPRPRRADRPMALARLPASNEPTLLAQLVPAPEEKNGKPVSAVAGTPQTLDEFRPISPVQAPDDPEAPDLDANASFQEAEYQEALLQRALDALKSEHQQLRTEALDQLASLLDPRATEALIAAANGGGELRALAVEALTRHAANHEYADATSVAALQRMAQDSDPAVKQLAQQALEAMEQYQLATAGQ